jgi:hypothetical protein
LLKLPVFADRRAKKCRKIDTAPENDAGWRQQEAGADKGRAVRHFMIEDNGGPEMQQHSRERDSFIWELADITPEMIFGTPFAKV